MKRVRNLILMAITGTLLAACNMGLPGEREPNNDPESATRIDEAYSFVDGGRVVRGLLYPGDVDYWKLNVDRDTALTVSLEEPARGEFRDTLLAIFDRNGNQLISNDDGGAGFMSRVSLLVGAGQYRIAVTGFGDDDFDGSGHEQLFAYRMITAVTAPSSQVTEADSASNDDPTTPQLLAPAPGDAALVTGTLTPGDIDHYAFQVDAGQIASAAVFDGYGGAQHDSILEILDAGGAVIASDDDSGPGMLSNVDFEPGTGGGGIYRVALFGFTGQEDFTYRLVVARD